jgi:hypothetical protein
MCTLLDSELKRKLTELNQCNEQMMILDYIQFQNVYASVTEEILR